MKKTIFFAGAMMLLASVACNKDPQTDNQPSVELKPQVTLSFNAALTTPTKTEIGNSETADGVIVHEIYWSKDDKIAVYPHDIDSDNPNTKVAGTTFTSEDLTDGSAAVATFTGTVAEADAYYAFYPTTAGATWSEQHNNFSVKLLSTQNPNGIASGFAVAEVTGTDNVTFNHVCGFVKFTIDETYAGTIKEVRFSGNNNENLAGNINVTSDGSCNTWGTPDTEIILTPAEGETFSEGTYYFTCFPVDLTEGLELTFVNTDDEEAVKSSAAEATIERAGVLNLGTVANLEFESVTPPLADGTYAIMVKVGETYKALSSSASGTRLAAVDAIYDGESSNVSISDATAIWTLANTTKNIYTIANDSNYLSHSGSGNTAETSNSENVCTIVSNEDGTYRIELESDVLRYFAYNPSSNYFGFYGTNTTSNYTLYVVPAVLVAKLDTPVIEVSVDDKTVTVTWTDVENATSYEVVCGEETQTVDPEVETCTLTMVDYGTYDVTVTAKADGYVSATSEVATCTLVSEDSKYYVKVTEELADWSGKYLIVYENNENDVAFNGNLTTLDAASNTITVSVSNNAIASTSTSDNASFIIEKVDNGYTIQSSSGYYIGQTSDANGLRSNTDTKYTNEITYSEGSVNILSGGAYLRYNSASNQLRFRYYKSTSYINQKAIQLYRLEE